MMYIGELAKLTGTTRKAIHHYESLGLIPVPQRKGRYRIHSETDANLICMIKRAKSLGFSLKEIIGVVSVRAKTRELPVEMIVTLIDQKRKNLRDIVNNAISLDRQLAELQTELFGKDVETNMDSLPELC
jgi:DNA-binding transcriptional MerR regulator